MEENKVVIDETPEEKEGAIHGDPAEELKKLSKGKLIEYVDALVKENDKLIAEADKIKKDNEALRAEKDAAARKADDYLGKLAGLKNDFERFKTRNAQVKESATEEGKGFVIQKMMPVLDTFDRAKQSVSDESTLAALDLILRQFEKILSDVGIEEIVVLGTAFDPNVANAVVKQPVEDQTLKGTVVGVVAKGFRQGDKILRYPQVIVGV